MADRELNVFIRAIDRLSGPSRQMSSSMKQLEAAALQAADVLQTRLEVASAAVVAGMAAAENMAAQYGDELAKTSDKTGVPVEDLARLRYAAEQSGVGFDQLRMSLARMSRTAYDASQGTGEAARAYQALGVSVTDASGNLKGGQALFTEVAEALRRVENPTQRSALAMQIFGRSGAELLPLLNKGAAGIDELAQRAEKLGLVMSEQAARDAERFKDAINDVKLASKGVVVAIGEAAFGTAEWTEKLAEGVGAVAGWVREHQGAVRVVGWLAGGISGLMLMVVGLNKSMKFATETTQMVRTILAWYTARVAANTTAINAETAALGANTTAQATNAAAARAAGAARGAGGAARAAGALGGLGGIGAQLSSLGTAAAGAAVPLGIIAASAAAIYLWKRNIDVAVDTHRLYDDTVKQTNERLKSMGETALEVKVGWRDWWASLKAGGPSVVRPSDVAKQRAIEKEAGQAVTKEQTTKALDALRAEGGGMTPRERAIADQKAAAAAARQSGGGAAGVAAEAAAAATEKITTTTVNGSITALPEAAMDLWRRMEQHLAVIAGAGTGGRSVTGGVGTRRVVPAAGGAGGVNINLVLDGRVIARQVLDLERGRVYGYQ